MPLKNMLIMALAMLATQVANLAHAETDAHAVWKLPLPLTDQNTRVLYKYSTTSGAEGGGRSSNVSGKIWLASRDLKSVKAQLVVPVPADILSQGALGPIGSLFPIAQLPTVTISIDRIPNLCEPTLISNLKPCVVRLEGKAAIGSFAKPVILLGKIERKAQSFELSGNSFLDTEAAKEQVPVLQLIDEASLKFTIQIPLA